MYIFKMKKYTKDKNGHKSAAMSPFYMIAALILLISYILIAKELIKNNYEKIAVPSAAASSILHRDYSMNESEQMLLTTIKNIMKPSDKVGRNESQNIIYYSTLKDYLENNRIRLNAVQTNVIREKLSKIQEILSGEMQTDYTRLSLDGKKIAFYLLGQIYEEVGLQLQGDSEGMIVKICDSQGNILYSNIPAKLIPEFQWDALVIMFICITILFVICLLIARKNRLFHKEDIYDGIDKEEFA